MRLLISLILTTLNFTQAARIVSDDDGPLHLTEPVELQKDGDNDAKMEPSQPHIQGDRQKSWSKIFREGIRIGLYKKIDDCCYNIPPISPLALAAGQGNESTLACTCKNDGLHKFSKMPGFLQSTDAEIYRRAERMTSDERAELQNELRENRWKWPDHLNSEGPKASGDRVPEPEDVSVNDAVEQAISRAEQELSSALNAPRDIKSFVYPLMVREFSKMLFSQGCVRDFKSRVCPLNWTLKLSGNELDDSELLSPAAIEESPEGVTAVCEPPAVYRGLCSSLDFYELLDRKNLTVLTRLKDLGEFCWFEYPCLPSPAIHWELPCPKNYRALNRSNITEMCIRKNNAYGRCAPLIDARWSDEREKLHYRISCDEVWPAEEEKFDRADAYESDAEKSFEAKFGADSEDDNGPIRPQ